jgi:CheY-like chemotaxis protein
MTPPIAPELELPPAERAKIKILLVEDNAINQQIALKTIRKLGFVVNAVWNGKEALDYLLSALPSGPGPHSTPDIILMDVQMPIIDGYRATHILRHHNPYNVLSKNIPIVAMTASAIQGDREKCKKAGMDDYLAKPVKGKTLERMLVRWAISRRVPGTPADSDGSEGDELCELGDEMGEGCEKGAPRSGYGTDLGSTSMIVADPRSKSDEDADDSKNKAKKKDKGKEYHMEANITRPETFERANSHHLTLPGAESEADRLERREEAEEKAIALRDEKLVEAAGMGPGQHGHTPLFPLTPVLGEEERGQTQALTEENVGRLEREGMAGMEKEPRRGHEMGGGTSFEDVAVEKCKSGGELGNGEGSQNLRPPIRRRWRDSERTITGLDAWVRDHNPSMSVESTSSPTSSSEQEMSLTP